MRYIHTYTKIHTYFTTYYELPLVKQNVSQLLVCVPIFCFKVLTVLCPLSRFQERG